MDNDDLQDRVEVKLLTTMLSYRSKQSDKLRLVPALAVLQFDDLASLGSCFANTTSTNSAQLPVEIKSSNGTFINGDQLSPESIESDKLTKAT